MKFESIFDFGEALESCASDHKLQIFLETWVPESKFLELRRSEGGVAIIREDKGPFIFAFGSNPPLPENPMRLSIERGAIQIETLVAKSREDWECYYLEPRTSTTGEVEAIPRSDQEIRAFLEAHAPDSSVSPGNPEIQSWVTIDSGSDLAAVAALCRWESGRYVVSSVATHRELRGLKYGQRLMSKIELIAHQNRIEILCLGVKSDNEPAKALYRKSGWSQLFQFTHIEI